MRSSIIKSILPICTLLLLSSCVPRIDGSEIESYITSLENIKADLTLPQKDSLEKCMQAILLEESIKDSIKAMNLFDGLSAAEILAKGGAIMQRKQRKQRKLDSLQAILDSISEAYVQDSIRKYKTSGLWEIRQFVDEFNEKTDEGYAELAAHGIFSNSAVTNANLLVKLLVTQDMNIQIFLYEYGSQQVKSYSSGGNVYQIKIKKNSKVSRGTGRMYYDRIDEFGGGFQNKLLADIKKGGKLKMLIEEFEEYGTPSRYLVEFDVTNFNGAMEQLNVR